MNPQEYGGGETNIATINESFPVQFGIPTVLVRLGCSIVSNHVNFLPERNINTFQADVGVTRLRCVGRVSRVDAVSLHVSRRGVPS